MLQLHPWILPRICVPLSMSHRCSPLILLARPRLYALVFLWSDVMEVDDVFLLISDVFRYYALQYFVDSVFRRNGSVCIRFCIIWLVRFAYDQIIVIDSLKVVGKCPDSMLAFVRASRWYFSSGKHCFNIQLGISSSPGAFFDGNFSIALCSCIISMVWWGVIAFG